MKAATEILTSSGYVSQKHVGKCVLCDLMRLYRDVLTIWLAWTTNSLQLVPSYRFPSFAMYKLKAFSGTHCQVKCSIDAECSLLRREGFSGMQDVILISCTGFLVADVAQSLLASQCSVVWLTHCEEVRGQVSSYNLACIDKNIHSK